MSMKTLKSIFYKSELGIESNMTVSTICKPISMVISYIYVPIVLNYLGVEKYGVWSTILTILSWISYFDIGIGNGLRNRLTESLSRKDGQSRKLVSSAYAFIAIIMIAVAIVFAAAASFVNWNRIFGVSDVDENLARVVIISVTFVAINFILSICKNVLYALQKAANVSIMELMVQIINMSGVLIARHIVESNLFVMAFIYGMSMILVNLVVSLIVYSKNIEVRPEFKSIDLQAGKVLTNLGLQFFVIQICALVLFTTDSLIISYLYSAANVTPYSTVIKMFNVIIGLYSALLAPVWSAVTKVKVQRQYQQLRNLIHKLQLIMLLFAGGTLLLMAVFRPVMKLWLGQDLNYSNSLIILGGMYCLLSNWCNTYANIANGLELMRVSMVTAVVQAVINIPLSLFFAEVVGMESAGVLAGTVLSMVVAAVVQPFAVNRAIRGK